MRALIGLAALAALAALSAPAFQRGAADLVAFGARHGLDRAGLPTVEASARARQRLERAIELDSGNPGHHEYLARWYEHAGAYRQALSHFRTALDARPAWPYAWANVARVKLRLGELDAEFEHAARQAARLGPWERGVQLEIVRIALEAERRFSPETRRTVLRMMSNALVRNEREVAELAVRFGRLDLLCAAPDISAYRSALRCI